MQQKTIARLTLAALLLGGGAQAALRPGTVAVYSNGEVERLIARDSNGTSWENQRKQILLRSHNPLLPVLEKREFLGQRGYTQQLVKGDPQRLLKAPAGSDVDFAVVRQRLDGRSEQKLWQCQSRGGAVLDVLGKPRQVRNYRCERYTLHHKLWTRKIKEQLDISYSPQLKLVVRQLRKRGGKTRERRLVSLLKPSQASYQNIRAAMRGGN